MFNAESDKKVVELVNLELDQAIKQYGEKYESIDIADNVLLEEIQEAENEIKSIKTAYIFWLEDLTEGNNRQKTTIDMIQTFAKNGMKELAQVAAVCEKIKRSF